MEQTIDAELSQWKGEHWSLVGPSWPGYGGIKISHHFVSLNGFPSTLQCIELLLSSIAP
jgi:hypothetical protein